MYNIKYIKIIYYVAYRCVLNIPKTAVPWYKGQESGSCSICETGCLSRLSLVLEPWRIPRSCWSSGCIRILMTQTLIPVKEHLSNRLKLPGKAGSSRQKAKVSFFMSLCIGCHQKVWLKFGVGCLISMIKSRKSLPGDLFGL